MSKLLQSDKEIHQEIVKNQSAADSHTKQKFEIESKFKSYITRMNEQATLMLRDYEESMKVKEIIRIMEGRF